MSKFVECSRVVETKVRYNAWRFSCHVGDVLVSETYTGYTRKFARMLFDALVCEKRKDLAHE